MNSSYRYIESKCIYIKELFVLTKENILLLYGMCRFYGNDQRYSELLVARSPPARSLATNLRSTTLVRMVALSRKSRRVTQESRVHCSRRACMARDHRSTSENPSTTHQSAGRINDRIHNSRRPMRTCHLAVQCWDYRGNRNYLQMGVCAFQQTQRMAQYIYSVFVRAMTFYSNAVLFRRYGNRASLPINPFEGMVRRFSLLNNRFCNIAFFRLGS